MEHARDAIVEQVISKSDMHAFATSEEISDPASNAIDGNENNMWHTKWNGSDKLPQSISINFKEKKNISSIAITPRKSGSNGFITKYEVYAINDGIETLIKKGDLEESSSIKTISFEKPIYAEGIKIKAIEVTNGFASIAELNFYENIGQIDKMVNYENLKITKEE